jgi:hypothetical protein
MGAFNEWVKGSLLEPPENRRAVTIALNLLYGAAAMARINALKGQGVNLPPGSETIAPVPVERIQSMTEQ